ncbi:hypothetical protein KIPB_001560 [Kipferlia bialata]|uniref:Uncharacterized protein n=1 Tax=Kipferlia bialata TaxID=797122 RepID=A0A9K3CQI0_9EUKA|nr:hypothetical protein KIPB_001560 [Kipferlia bialata]|eukprot:g1560.t1
MSFTSDRVLLALQRSRGGRRMYAHLKPMIDVCDRLNHYLPPTSTRQPGGRRCRVRMFVLDPKSVAPIKALLPGQVPAAIPHLTSVLMASAKQEAQTRTYAAPAVYAPEGMPVQRGYAAAGVPVQRGYERDMEGERERERVGVHGAQAEVERQRQRERESHQTRDRIEAELTHLASVLDPPPRGYSSGYDKESGYASAPASARTSLSTSGYSSHTQSPRESGSLSGASFRPGEREREAVRDRVRESAHSVANAVSTVAEVSGAPRSRSYENRVRSVVSTHQRSSRQTHRTVAAVLGSHSPMAPVSTRYKPVTFTSTTSGPEREREKDREIVVPQERNTGSISGLLALMGPGGIETGAGDVDMGERDLRAHRPRPDTKGSHKSSSLGSWERSGMRHERDNERERLGIKRRPASIIELPRVHALSLSMHTRKSPSGTDSTPHTIATISSGGTTPRYGRSSLPTTPRETMSTGYYGGVSEATESEMTGPAPPSFSRGALSDREGEREDSMSPGAYGERERGRERERWGMEASASQGLDTLAQMTVIAPRYDMQACKSLRERETEQKRQA